MALAHSDGLEELLLGLGDHGVNQTFPDSDGGTEARSHVEPNLSNPYDGGGRSHDGHPAPKKYFNPHWVARSAGNASLYMASWSAG
jgi:hypothetical protein